MEKSVQSCAALHCYEHICEQSAVVLKLKSSDKKPVLLFYWDVWCYCSPLNRDGWLMLPSGSRCGFIGVLHLAKEAMPCKMGWKVWLDSKQDSLVLAFSELHAELQGWGKDGLLSTFVNLLIFCTRLSVLCDSATLLLCF